MPFSIRPFCRFPVLSFVTIAMLYLVHTPVHAGLCMPPVVQKDSPYQYILSLTDALSYAESALDRIPKDLNVKLSEYDLLLGLKLAKADFECAGSQVSPYAASSTETIQISARGTTLPDLPGAYTANELMDNLRAQVPGLLGERADEQTKP